MNIRGVGDAHGFRRLAWLFATTVIAPALLLGLLAVGALGQRLWSEREIGDREVDAQIPHLAARVARHAEDLEAQVSELARACPSADCEPPAGVTSWNVTGEGIEITFDEELLAAWCAERLAAPPGWQGELVLGPSEGAHALPPPLDGWTLTHHAHRDTGLVSDRGLSFLAAIMLLGLLMSGVTVGLRAAAREIQMSRRQTELVSRISHELRTPLTAIRMFVDTLRDGRLPRERQDECLDMLGEETSRLSRRIEEVLRWARMEARARRYRLAPTPASEIVAEALAAFRSQILFQDDELELHVEVPDDLPVMHVDRDAIVEALVNLLGNAFKHSSVPRVIRLSAMARGLQVGLAVQDNGPGIAPRDQRRIFEKFYRPDDGPNDGKTGGAGLGLAIVRAIVRDHGGRVQLETSELYGSRFTLWLPTTWTRGYTGAGAKDAAEDM